MVQHLKEKLREICDFLAFFIVFLLFGASCYAAFQSILLKRWIYSVYFTLFSHFYCEFVLENFFLCLTLVIYLGLRFGISLVSNLSVFNLISIDIYFRRTFFMEMFPFIRIFFVLSALSSF